jgi:hypothetical protein
LVLDLPHAADLGVCNARPPKFYYFPVIIFSNSAAGSPPIPGPEMGGLGRMGEKVKFDQWLRI